MKKSSLTIALILCATLNCAAQSAPTVEPLNTQQQYHDAETVIYLEGLIRELESPTLRVYFSYQLASYAWENGIKGTNAALLSKDALKDIKSYSGEMPDHMVNSLRRGLLSQLQLHAPLVWAEVREASNDQSNQSEMENAFSLLNTKGGTGPAVEKARGAVARGEDPGDMMVFFLSQLEVKEPETVPLLLSDILGAGERRPGGLSVNTLFVLKHLYLREKTSTELQNRYLAALVRTIRRKNQWANPAEMANAYGLIKGTLPLIEKQQPALYAIASEQELALASQLPPQVRERMLIDERVKRSPQPLTQLLNEIDAVVDSGLKEELTVQAAQLALQDGQLKTALELSLKVQSEQKETAAWRDQFIGVVVVAALGAGDLDLARRAVASIGSPSARSSALQKVALYQKESRDLAGAGETLNEALKIVEKMDGGVQKAMALSELASSFVKVNQEKVIEVAEAFVEVANSLQGSKKSSANSDDAVKKNAEEAMYVARSANLLFWQLAASTTSGKVQELTQKIRRPEVSTPAIVGASIGSMTANRSRQTATAAVKHQ
jgi:hypothetical protein